MDSEDSEDWEGDLTCFACSIPRAAREAHAGAVANREPLRGMAERVLDHVFEECSARQWAELLEAPLERAAGDGDSGLARKLVEAGAEMEHALHEAARGGHGEIVDNLLASGARIDSTNPDGSPTLHVAAEGGHADIIRSLLLGGATADELDDLRRTALYVAVEAGHLAATEALLAAGADADILCTDELEQPALHLATHEEHVGVLRALIEHGADVN